MISHKNERWLPYGETESESGGEGIERRVLAYSDDLMLVENRFQKGAVGKLHHHPHTQISYIKSGSFEFTIGGEKRIVREGDTLLKT